MPNDIFNINCSLKKSGSEQPAGIERQTNQTPSGKYFIKNNI